MKINEISIETGEKIDYTERNFIVSIKANLPKGKDAKPRVYRPDSLPDHDSLAAEGKSSIFSRTTRTFGRFVPEAVFSFFFHSP